MNKKMSTPPPRILSNKYLYRIVCAIICAIFAFMLVGCGDSDYKNFIQNQKRYEAEKELVDLLRDYDTAYRIYTSSGRGGENISFSIDGTTIFTDANVKATEICYFPSEVLYCAIIHIDKNGITALTDVINNNPGDFDIILNSGDIQTVLSSSDFTIGNNSLYIARKSEQAAKEFCCLFSAGPIKTTAPAYNTKRAELFWITACDYLPAALPEMPQLLDVSTYLKKAEAMGF